jgi:1,4-alpha-glucan branching enzyme
MNYRVGVPEDGYYEEIFNSDAAMFGGSNMGNAGGVLSTPVPIHERKNSISITLPPLGVLVFRKR